MNKLLWILLLALLWSAPGSGHAQAAELATAQKQFNKYCAKCHGAGGRGDGEQAATLNHKPKDWTNCTEMAKISDEERFKITKFGGQQVHGQQCEMPGMGKALSDDEIRGLVAHIRNFCQQPPTAAKEN
ncbi:MAG: cytochrome c [Deltaproteobacteria bacterium]|nr:cytochrome c [Deltaproteobacteria bacterium]